MIHIHPRMRLHLAYGLVAVVLMVVLQIVLSHTTSAIGDRYFDPNDTIPNGVNIDLSVGQTTYVRKSSATLVVYFKSNSGSLKFYDYNYCPSSGPDVRQSGDEFTGSNLGSGANITDFNIQNGPDFVGEYFAGSSSNCNDIKTVDLTNLPFDNDSGYYYAKIAVTHIDKFSGFDGIQNMFHVRAFGNGAVITHAAGTTGYDVTTQQRSSSPNNTDYQVLFGSDCSVTSAVTKTIHFYDIDNDGGSGAQLHGKITVELFESNIDGSGRRRIDLAGRQPWTPPSNNNATTDADFTARPNKRYELRIENVYKNNTLQYGIPFDGIFYLTGCAAWNLNATSTVKGTTGGWTDIVDANPGDTIYFRHKIDNTGTSQSDSSGRRQTSAGASDPVSGPWTNAGLQPLKINGLASIYTPSATGQAFTIPAGALPGTYYCERFTANPKNQNGGIETSTPACALIASNFTLNPTISLSKDMVTSASDLYTVTSTVANGQASGSTQWVTTRMVYQPGAVPEKPGSSSSQDPCAFFSNVKRVSCDTTFQTGTQAFIPPSTLRTKDDSFGSDYGPGVKVCYATSVNPPTGNPSPAWRHSELLCLLPGKKPKVQIWGGDLRAQGDVTTSLTGNSPYVLGSWVEYGVFSVGTNTNFGSGAALDTGTAIQTSPSTWNKLTFANVDNTGVASFGNYQLPEAPALATYLHTLPLSGAAFNSNLGALGASGRYVVGNATINGSNIGTKGRWIIIDATGQTVTVNGSITYNPGTMRDVSDVPQVIILADTINITNAATNVDAWLLASNAINTCSEIDAGNPSNPSNLLTSARCDNQLTINGPVATDKLYLYRTAKSDDDSNKKDPAEIFNYRADAYLWVYSRLLTSNTARTVYETDLPPRF